MRVELVRLGDVCEVIAGQSPESGYYNQEKDGLPFFQGKADFGIHEPEVRYYTKKVTKKAIPNDILLSVRAPVGPTNICNVESCIGRGLAAIRGNNKAHYKYVYWYFKFIEPQLSMTGNGSTFSAIRSIDVKNIEIPLPHPSIQKQIADTLDNADALRQNDQLLIQNYDELALSIFFNMFGDPVKNEMGWPTKKLGTLCEMRRGASPRPIQDFIGDDVPWIKIGDATKGDDIYITKTKVCITKEGSLKSVMLEEGSLVFANCGVSLGFARILKIKGCIHDGWLAFAIHNKKVLSDIFLLKLINFITPHLLSLAPGGTQPNLNTGIMKDLDIILPPIDLQDRFAKALQSILEGKRSLNEMNADKVFYSLLNKYFE